MKEALKSNWKLFLLVSLTLGLAPFTPEPHLWGKLTWVIGGANGMQLMDWLDLLMHGAPWLLLVISGVLNLTDRKSKQA
ncbi:MAG: hypothetical protein ACI8ZM_001144 [Crocinitomix sp.]|jgi:hypothetical protein